MRSLPRIALLCLALAVGALASIGSSIAQTAATTTASDAKPAPLPEGVVPYGLTPQLLGGLRAGGYLIFFRHGLTPNYADPVGDGAGDCSTQRNLSKEGIDQMEAVGVAFRELEIPIGIVRASPMCRTMDSAWHAFGRFERDRALKLNGKEPDRDLSEAKVWKHVRNIAKILPLPGTNSVFVSHGTIGEVFGTGYLEEGEAVIVRPDGFGSWRAITHLKSDQWKLP